MILEERFFNNKPHPQAHGTNAALLLGAVNPFLDEAAAAGAYGYWIDPDTGTQISGAKGGSGDGGYRLPSSKTGSKTSKHLEANAVDVYDPDRKLAAWCVLNKAILAKYGLYMEDPRWTPGWVHLQRVPPGSGKIIYVPSKSAPLAKALPGQGAIPVLLKL